MSSEIKEEWWKFVFSCLVRIAWTSAHIPTSANISKWNKKYLQKFKLYWFHDRMLFGYIRKVTSPNEDSNLLRTQIMCFSGVCDLTFLTMWSYFLTYDQHSPWLPLLFPLWLFSPISFCSPLVQGPFLSVCTSLLTFFSVQILINFACLFSHLSLKGKVF